MIKKRKRDGKQNSGQEMACFIVPRRCIIILTNTSTRRAKYNKTSLLNYHENKNENLFFRLPVWGCACSSQTQSHFLMPKKFFQIQQRYWRTASRRRWTERRCSETDMVVIAGAWSGCRVCCFHPSRSPWGWSGGLRSRWQRRQPNCWALRIWRSHSMD